MSHSNDPRQLDLPLAFPEFTQDQPLLPVRMVNEFQYCPRLAYLEWVQGEWEASADTVEGSHSHRRVDKPSGDLPSPANKPCRSTSRPTRPRSPRAATV